MEKVCERCCGLDVHQKRLVACLRVPGPQGRRTAEVQTFGTTTPELLALADWLLEAGCTHVAMESTGVYWKPVFNILEGVCEVLLVNTHHIKAVPGRKTDVRDCEWIADLGPSHFDRLNIERLTRHYLRRLEDLGLQVTVQPLPEAA